MTVEIFLSRSEIVTTVFAVHSTLVTTVHTLTSEKETEAD